MIGNVYVISMKGTTNYLNKRVCGKCGANGSIKKYNIYFAYNRKARMCCNCLNEFENPDAAAKWFEEHAIYKDVKLFSFSKEKTAPKAKPLGQVASRPVPSATATASAG